MEDVVSLYRRLCEALELPLGTSEDVLVAEVLRHKADADILAQGMVEELGRAQEIEQMRVEALELVRKAASLHHGSRSGVEKKTGGI